VNESTESIASLGPKATEFHITKPSGWPPGQYTVELFVNDQSAGTKQFTVKK
jgi:outer membrane usher protein FimD/PapC